MSVSIKTLKDISLFENMKDEAIEHVIESSETSSLSTEETLFEQGDNPTGTFFVILNGEVGIRKMMRTEKSTVDTLQEGDFFGELALFTGEKRKADAVSLTSQVELLEIPKSTLKLLKSENPKSLNEFYEAMFDQLAHRFHSLAQKAEKSQFWL